MQEPLVPPRPRRSGARARAAETRAPRTRAPLVAEATCSVQVIRPFARYLARLGLDCEALLGRHGLSAAMLQERDLRVPHHESMALMREAMALSGDPAIGVRAARCDEPGDFDVVEYAAANCASVGEALKLAARFVALWHDGIVMELDVVPPMATLRVRGIGDMPHEPAAIEFTFASLLATSSRSIGHPTRPLRVDLAHPRPDGLDDTGIYEEVFREVRFGCDEYAMWMNSAALDLPHGAPDRSLLQILTHHADGLLRQLSSRPHGFAERARA